jgi:hypothetical protein
MAIISVEDRLALFAEFEAAMRPELERIANNLRETATALRIGEHEGSGGINRFHAANRLEKRANELCKKEKA